MYEYIDKLFVLLLMSGYFGVTVYNMKVPFLITCSALWQLSHADTL